MNTTSPVLEVRSLQKSYGSMTAVDGISFSIPAGSCFGLLGPNGAGKSTTIEIMEGILPADAGQVLFHGQPITKEFHQSAGIQFQSTALQDFITSREALLLFKSFYKNSLGLDQLIESCALEDFLEQDVRKISGGQRQRLLLAIALVNDPEVVFLDEPTTGLDPQARRNFWDLITKIKAQNKTILLTTHYMEEAHQLCDDIAIMDKGKIIAQGEPKVLLHKHFGHVVLELPKTDFTLQHSSFCYPVYEHGDYVEILAEKVELAIDALRQGGVRLENLRVRERSLEDLFLALTGEALRS